MLKHLSIVLTLIPPLFAQDHLQINDQEYFEMPGFNVMVFHDFYPEGHQGGVGIIHHGVRTATNGDIRLSPTPGQWQPLPKPGQRIVDRDHNEIRINLTYPDEKRHRRGFNPMIYPDLELAYQVRVTAEGAAFRIQVDFNEPIPTAWVGKVGFHLELFPTDLFGKSYYMDETAGLFPQQANGPLLPDPQKVLQTQPLATGRRLSIAPESPTQHMTIESRTGDLHLIDGRGNHNNGWFVVRNLVPAGATKRAVDWIVTPTVQPQWRQAPRVQVSQVGCHPEQPKRAIIELDKRTEVLQSAKLLRVRETGGLQIVLEQPVQDWGTFLRYRYGILDFSTVQRPGLYVIRYGDYQTHPFAIRTDVYQRHVWQPTLEYYLPVQMCHMRVNEKYRVWHGCCHLDDALMAPPNINHFDGYVQGDSTLTRFAPLQPVPGLNVGGWHDAGDYDLRVESQAKTVQILSWAYEAFDLDYDQTLIDQEQRLAEIHHPDGKPDCLQQIEHGVLTILAGYRQLGRLYRGIICPTLRQYVMLGDAASMTDNRVYRAQEPERNIQGLWFTQVANHYSRLFDPLMQRREIKVIAPELDDRLVFTEENPGRALQVTGALAAASRVLRGYDQALAQECQKTAESLWQANHTAPGKGAQIPALAELILTTQKQEYKDALVALLPQIQKDIHRSGWTLGRVLPHIDDVSFKQDVTQAIRQFKSQIDTQQKENPFGVPYKPHIWGAGWGIQSFGMQQYFLHTGWPEIFPPDYLFNALHFVLGCHPGANTASFASGVGARSLLVAYGVNRAEWSYIPGGVGSGTALIRPDFPEMKEWPYLWQQTEYVMGGGATNFMFLALAANHLLTQD